MGNSPDRSPVERQLPRATKPNDSGRCHELIPFLPHSIRRLNSESRGRAWKTVVNGAFNGAKLPTRASNGIVHCEPPVENSHYLSHPRIRGIVPLCAIHKEGILNMSRPECRIARGLGPSVPPPLRGVLQRRPMQPMGSLSAVTQDAQSASQITAPSNAVMRSSKPVARSVENAVSCSPHERRHRTGNQSRHQGSDGFHRKVVRCERRLEG